MKKMKRSERKIFLISFCWKFGGQASTEQIMKKDVSNDK